MQEVLCHCVGVHCMCFGAIVCGLPVVCQNFIEVNYHLHRLILAISKKKYLVGFNFGNSLSSIFNINNYKNYNYAHNTVTRITDC